MPKRTTQLAPDSRGDKKHRAEPVQDGKETASLAWLSVFFARLEATLLSFCSRSRLLLWLWTRQIAGASSQHDLAVIRLVCVYRIVFVTVMYLLVPIVTLLGFVILEFSVSCDISL